MSRTVSSAQYDQIVAVVRQYPEGATFRDIQQLLSPSPAERTLSRYLATLIEQNRLVTLGVSRDLKYFIGAEAAPAVDQPQTAKAQSSDIGASNELTAGPTIPDTGPAPAPSQPPQPIATAQTAPPPPAAAEPTLDQLFAQAAVRIVGGVMPRESATGFLQNTGLLALKTPEVKRAFVNYGLGRLDRLTLADAESFGLTPQQYQRWRTIYGGVEKRDHPPAAAKGDPSPIRPSSAEKQVAAPASRHRPAAANNESAGDTEDADPPPRPRKSFRYEDTLNYKIAKTIKDIISGRMSREAAGKFLSTCAPIASERRSGFAAAMLDELDRMTPRIAAKFQFSTGQYDAWRKVYPKINAGAPDEAEADRALERERGCSPDEPDEGDPTSELAAASPPSAGAGANQPGSEFAMLSNLANPAALLKSLGDLPSPIAILKEVVTLKRAALVVGIAMAFLVVVQANHLAGGHTISIPLFGALWLPYLSHERRKVKKTLPRAVVLVAIATLGPLTAGAASPLANYFGMLLNAFWR